MIGALDVEATLKFLVPGFLALKVYYSLGLSWRRTDFEWTVWSIVVSAVLSVFLGRFSLTDDQRFLLSLAAGLAVGMLLALGWKLWRLVDPKAGVSLHGQAWDSVFDRPTWAQVRLMNGSLVFGYVATVAKSAQTDDLDIYLRDPHWVDASTGTRSPMGVVGILMSRSQIVFVQVLSQDSTRLSDRARLWWSAIQGHLRGRLPIKGPPAT